MSKKNMQGIIGRLNKVLNRKFYLSFSLCVRVRTHTEMFVMHALCI